MDISINKSGQVSVVVIRGQIDATTSKAAEDRLVELINAGERRLVLDLGQLDYISSVGLRVLILVAKRLKQAEGAVAICALQPSVQELFEIAGFDAVFRIFDTQGEAVSHVS